MRREPLRVLEAGAGVEEDDPLVGIDEAGVEEAAEAGDGRGTLGGGEEAFAGGQQTDRRRDLRLAHGDSGPAAFSQGAQYQAVADGGGDAQARSGGCRALPVGGVFWARAGSADRPGT